MPTSSDDLSRDFGHVLGDACAAYASYVRNLGAVLDLEDSSPERARLVAEIRALGREYGPAITLLNRHVAIALERGEEPDDPILEEALTLSRPLAESLVLFEHLDPETPQEVVDLPLMSMATIDALLTNRLRAWLVKSRESQSGSTPEPH